MRSHPDIATLFVPQRHAVQEKMPRHVSRAARVVLVLSSLLIAVAARAANAPATSREVGHVTVRARAANGQPIEGASVTAGRVRAGTDAQGMARLAPPAGPARIAVTRLGFLPDTLVLDVSARADTLLDVILIEQPLEIAPIVVSTTRTQRRIEDEPERVEVLAGDDVSEKAQMRPGDLKVLLTEMSGVRATPGAPGLGAASLRIQGLRGQYTEVLADGLPLYGASAPEFGLVQIPPLDLEQAEVIKGAATALYGPAALGGVLNLISRRPAEGRGENVVVLNQTSRSGGDGALWLSHRPSESWGWTLLGGVHHQHETDVNHDGWSDLPGHTRGELRPRLFWTGAGGRSVIATAGVMAEDRTGGAISTAASGFPFSEGLDTRRGDAGVVARLPFGTAGVLAVRTAVNGEWQRHRADSPAAGAVPYDDRRHTLFAEATWLAARGRLVWLVGGAFRRDAYRNDDLRGFDYAYDAPAFMAHGTVAATKWLSASASGRVDAHSRSGTIASPRVSFLVHAGHTLEARLSAGTGFSAPTPFTEETQAIQMARLVPPAGLRAERAQSVSLDLTRRAGPLELNGTLFASAIHHAVLLDEMPGDSLGRVALVNAAGATRTRGAELFAVWKREPIIATAYYAWLHSTEVAPENRLRRDVPLDPRHNAGLDVAWEEDESGSRVGLEVFYVGRQSLEHDPRRTESLPFATIGVLASQRVGRVVAYVNAENLGNVRQTRWEPIVLPAPGPGGRQAVDAWSPLDGRLFNAGVRIPF